MSLKNNKGVTLIALTVMIVVIIIISSISVTEGFKLMSIKRVNYMNSDIQMINTAIADYYLKNNEIPILNFYGNKSYLTSIFGGSDALNPNDGDNYYVIDFSSLENLTLNYGRDFQKWTNSNDNEQYKDLYIINDVTHQVYYIEGATSNEKTYYTTRNKLI